MRTCKAKVMPSITVLDSMFDLDREAGVLRRKRSHRGYKAGEAAGTAMPSGHLQTGIERKRYLVHRLIYFMATGIDPGDNIVDHVNGEPQDNRPGNLRLASKAENGRHRTKLESTNTSGHRNVSWLKASGKWLVSLTVNGRRICKTFKSLGDAVAAAEAMRKHHYGEFSGIAP